MLSELFCMFRCTSSLLSCLMGRSLVLPKAGREGLTFSLYHWLVPPAFWFLDPQSQLACIPFLPDLEVLMAEPEHCAVPFQSHVLWSMWQQYGLYIIREKYQCCIKKRLAYKYLPVNFKIPDKKYKLIVESKHLHLVIASKHKQERGWKKRSLVL